MKTPNEDESKRCLQIRKRSKRGEYTSPADNLFCNRMYMKYPEWYESVEVEDEIFNDTVPIGSNLRRVNGKWVYLK